MISKATTEFNDTQVKAKQAISGNSRNILLVGFAF